MAHWATGAGVLVVGTAKNAAAGAAGSRPRIHRRGTAVVLGFERSPSSHLIMVRSNERAARAHSVKPAPSIRLTQPVSQKNYRRRGLSPVARARPVVHAAQRRRRPIRRVKPRPDRQTLVSRELAHRSTWKFILSGHPGQRESQHDESARTVRRRRFRFQFDGVAELPIEQLGRSLSLKPFTFDPDTGMSCMLLRYTAGFINPWHTHDCAHGMYVLSGTLRTHKGDFGPGSFVCSPRG